MRISDWSSDVCSSDLYIGGNAKGPDLIGRTQVEQAIGGLARQADGAAIDGIGVARFMIELGEQGIIGAQRQAAVVARRDAPFTRSEEHTSELQSLMRISYAVFCLKKKKTKTTTKYNPTSNLT